MKDMFHTRPILIEGVTELVWLKRDKEAFQRILGDWKDSKKDFMEPVKKFNTVVQAGGNCGMYPRFYANYFDNVVTFEPDDDNFEAMELNCQGPQYAMYKKALGDKHGSLHLNTEYVPNIGKHFIENKPGNVEIVTIDSLNLKTCDLIHLDVERYEDKVILGAKQTIDRFNPVVIVERQRGEDHLFDMGYKLYKRLRVDAVYVHKSSGL